MDMAMHDFIKVKDNIWLNINNIISIEYYPDGNGIYQYADAYYLIITTSDTNEPYYAYDNKEEAMGIIEKLKQHGVILE